METQATTKAAAPAARILVAGLGDAGCNVAARLLRDWGPGPELVAINTDISAFKGRAGMRCVQLGVNLTEGAGAGGNPEAGRRSAEADRAVLQEVLAEADLLFMIAGMGGGTGAGAAPALARTAAEAGARVLAFAILPFGFEGARRREQAASGLAALREAADAVICLPNQRLFDLCGGSAAPERAFEEADGLLAAGIYAIWRALSGKGTLNLRLPDFKGMLEQGRTGGCVMACVQGSGPDRVAMALEALRAHPLLEHGGVLARAPACLVSALSGPDLSLGELNSLMPAIEDMAGAGAMRMAGLVCDPDWQDRLLVTVLACDKSVDAAAPAAPGNDAAAAFDKPDSKHEPPVEADSSRLTQQGLFDQPDGAAIPGRFKNIEPTIHEGQNLDIPTFIRRRIPLQKRSARA
ncbi:MAG: hypothetical protein GX608_01040 [Lentisphaerae bacterium]|nr:hypothetical protein [Lentisphaerota bacterium]